MMSSVKLYKNIGLDPTFKKTIDFISKTKQIEWFNSKTYDLFDNVNYNKLQNTLKINTDIDFSTALQYTYCVIEELETTNNRRYFCFIDSVSLISVGVIEFNLVLDPIQTFMCEFTLGESMVTRKHMDRWNGSNYPAYRVPNNINIHTNNYTSLLDTEFYQKITNPSNVQPKADESKLFICIMSYSETLDSKREQITTVIAPIGNTYNTNGTVKNNGIFGLEYDNKQHIYPTIQQVMNGELPKLFSIPPSDIINISVVPLISFVLEGSQNEDGNIHYRFDNPVFFQGIIESTEKYIYEGTEYYYAMQKFSYQNVTGSSDYVEYNLDIRFPVKPSITNTRNTSHEPALYKQPFDEYRITDGLGNIKMQLPEQCIMNKDNTVKIQTVFNVSTVYNVLYIGEDLVTSTEDSKACIIEASYLPLVSDNWLDYSLTAKDVDRQLVSNQNIQSAIDNLIFMSYGGSLIASRGASGTDTSKKRQQNIMTGVTQAVGLAAGASIVSSVVDSHYAWENQKLSETRIQNKPNNLLYATDGMGMVTWDKLYYKFTITTCDTSIYNDYYEQFFKYGYEVNKFIIPNILSRKYFDYILTDGCIIEGSLNTVIKQEIAMIFDNGITIFHGDYTNTLEYPTYENIERTLM